MNVIDRQHVMPALFKLFSSIKLIVFDFDGVFTDNCVYVTEAGVESVRCWRSDGIGIARLHDYGVGTMILSKEKNPVVSMRSRKLGIECIQGVDDKAAAIFEIAQRREINLQDISFVGNDINDIPALKHVGVPVAVADAYPEILPYVVHRTNKPGGKGAVREVCDLIISAKMTS